MSCDIHTVEYTRKSTVLVEAGTSLRFRKGNSGGTGKPKIILLMKPFCKKKEAPCHLRPCFVCLKGWTGRDRLFSILHVAYTLTTKCTQGSHSKYPLAVSGYQNIFIPVWPKIVFHSMAILYKIWKFIWNRREIHVIVWQNKSLYTRNYQLIKN